MPFNQPFPRSFTESSIRRHAPVVPGVYGLCNSIEWIYIGECNNIQQALLEHLQEINTPVLRRQPTGFVFEACDCLRGPTRQDRLILEYEPSCNRHWSRHA